MPSNAELRQMFRLDQQRRGLLPSTIRCRDIRLKALSIWLKDTGYFEMTLEGFQKFLDTRKMGSKARYGWISHVHCLSLWGISAGLTEHDITKNLLRPKLRRALPRPARTDELLRALGQAEPDVKCWMLLAGLQGLRCQEIAGLRREDVLEVDGLLRVVESKGGDERMLALHPDVYAALTCLPMPKAGYVFERKMGGRYTPAHFSSTFSRALRELEVNAVPHQLRHWFASSLWQQTHDLRLLQEAMGHKNPATTAIYTAFDKVEQAAGIRALSFDRSRAAADTALSTVSA